MPLVMLLWSYLLLLIIACLHISVCSIGMGEGRHVCPAHRWRSQYNFVELILSIHCHVASRDWTGVIRFFNKHVSSLSHLLPSLWFYTGVDHMSHTNTHSPENNLLLYHHRHSPLFFRIGDQVVVLCGFPSYLPRFMQPSTRGSGESFTQSVTWYQLHLSPWHGLFPLLSQVTDQLSSIFFPYKIYTTSRWPFSV